MKTVPAVVLKKKYIRVVLVVVGKGHKDLEGKGILNQGVSGQSSSSFSGRVGHRENVKRK